MKDASDYPVDGLITFPILTTGSTEVVNVRFSRDMVIAVTNNGVSSAIFVIEGSLDNALWGNLDASDVNTTIAAGITTLFSFDGALPPYIRIRKVSGVESATVKLFLGMVV